MTRRITHIISTHAGGSQSGSLVRYVPVVVIVVIGRNIRLLISFLILADGFHSG